MSLPELIRWQREGYPRYHRSRANLLLHIVAVPVFLAGDAALLLAIVLQSWAIAAAATAAIVVSLALQGRGHRFEPVPPEPFTGPGNALLRILLEQWLTFPRFVLTGGWGAALRRAPSPPDDALPRG